MNTDNPVHTHEILKGAAILLAMLSLAWLIAGISKLFAPHIDFIDLATEIGSIGSTLVFASAGLLYVAERLSWCWLRLAFANQIFWITIVVFLLVRDLVIALTGVLL